MDSDRKFQVVCTGRGTHGQISWPELTLTEDGNIVEKRYRSAPVPTEIRGKTVHVEGDSKPAVVSRKMPVEATQHRSEAGTWRWRCPRCGIDRPLLDENLRRWMRATQSDMLDISHLPR